MFMISAFGIAGGAILLVAWLNEVYQIHKSKDVEAISLKFLLVYLAATILLLAHSVDISDIVFTWLNVILIIITLIEIELVTRKREKIFRRKKSRQKRGARS